MHTCGAGPPCLCWGPGALGPAASAAARMSCCPGAGMWGLPAAGAASCACSSHQRERTGRCKASQAFVVGMGGVAG